MKCNRCGRDMRTKDVYMGDDDYGDPIYNEYAFCDQCRIKKNIEGQRNQKPKKRGYAGLEDIDDDYDSAPRRKQSRSQSRSSSAPTSRNKNGGCLNALIKLFAILIVLMIIFLVILFNKDKIPFIKDLGKSKTAQTSSLNMPSQNIKHNIPGYTINI